MLYLPIATVLQGQLEKAGIRLKLEVTDRPSFMKKIGNATAESSIYMPVRVPDADIPLTNFTVRAFLRDQPDAIQPARSGV